MLAFDARLPEALAIGLPLMLDERQPPPTRSTAAIGVIGAEYWLGRGADAVAHADLLADMATAPETRQAIPYAAASLELLAVCALIDQGDLGRRRGARPADAPRGRGHRRPVRRAAGRILLGRVALARGQGGTAVRLFRRCAGGGQPVRPVHRPAPERRCWPAPRPPSATSATAAAALAAGQDKPRIKPYEPEWELAKAAVLAAGLRMDEAAERAAWAAGVAADQRIWNSALAGYHDAARYGAAQHALAPVRDAAAEVGGALAACFVGHVAALAERDGAALDQAARRFEGLAWHCSRRRRPPRRRSRTPSQATFAPPAASGQRSAGDRAACEGAVSPWLTGSTERRPADTA